MAFSKSVRAILSQPWLIDPAYAEAYLPTVMNILTKGSIGDIAERAAPTAVNYFMNEGTVYRTEDPAEIPPGSVAILDINGPMLKYGDWCTYGATEMAAYAIAHENNPNVVGQVWIMETGGGAVSAIHPYVDVLLNRKKPIGVVSDLLASAGVYVGVHADFIWAENNISSMFGSVGVMITVRNFEERLKSMGVKEITAYSDFSEDKNKAYTELLQGNDALVKDEMLNPLASQFIEVVKKYRPSLKSETPGLLSGKMFFADQALEYGLIDNIGSLPQAVEKVKELAAVQSFMNS